MRLRNARRVVCLAVAGLGVLATVASAQVTVAGVGYTAYAYQLKVDSSLAPAAHQNNFDVARAYIRVLGKFPEGISTQVTADVDGRKAAANQQTFRLKYAFVAWQPNGKGPLTYKIGAIHTAWLDWEENLNDYRFQGTMPMERAGFLSSSDFGAGIDGLWNFDQFNAQLTVVDGENYNNAPGDNRKDVEFRGSYRLAKTDLGSRTSGLRISGYGRYGLATGGGKRSRFIGMLSYKSKMVTLAGEVGITQDSVSATLNDQKGRVLAAYGVFNVPNSKVSFYGRVDSFDPNTDSTLTSVNTATNVSFNTQTRVIGGVTYTVGPNLRFLLDVDANSVKGGATNAFDRTRQTIYFHTEFKF